MNKRRYDYFYNQEYDSKCFVSIQTDGLAVFYVLTLQLLIVNIKKYSLKSYLGIKC